MLHRHPLLPLADWFPDDHWPSISCPICQRSTVQRLGKTVTVPSTQTAYQAVVNDGYLDPDTLHGTFTSMLRCSDPTCTAQLTIAGDWFVSDETNELDGPKWGENLRVKYISPALHTVAPLPGTPDPVSAAIGTANELIWISPSAAANQLRQAVEILLTHLKVRKMQPANTRRRLTTHARIDALRPTYPDVADALEAVKWIGNTGSHESAVTIKYVLEGARYLELALRSLYDRTDEQLLKNAAKVNARKGRPARSQK